MKDHENKTLIERIGTTTKCRIEVHINSITLEGAKKSRVSKNHDMLPRSRTILVRNSVMILKKWSVCIGHPPKRGVLDFPKSVSMIHLAANVTDAINDVLFLGPMPSCMLLIHSFFDFFPNLGRWQGQLCHCKSVTQLLHVFCNICCSCTGVFLDNANFVAANIRMGVLVIFFFPDHIRCAGLRLSGPWVIIRISGWVAYNKTLAGMCPVINSGAKIDNASCFGPFELKCTVAILAAAVNTRV